MLLSQQLHAWPDGKEYCQGPIGSNCIWLDGHTYLAVDTTEASLLKQFGKRRSLLSVHLCVFREKGAV